MIKMLKNKHGYTLTYAIIIIGLLMILTASIITVTYMNFKQARIGGEVNTSFYANDGAIEEALTELSRYTYNAEVLAWEAVNNGGYNTQFLWGSFITAVKDDINSDVLTIDEANNVVSRAIRGYFETNFYNYILEGSPVSHNYFVSGGIGIGKYPDYTSYSDVTFTGTIEIDAVISTKLLATTFSPTNIIAPTIEAGSPNPADISTISLSDPIADGSLKLTIKSDGTYHKRNKKLSVLVEIRPPQYNFSVATPTQSIQLQKNDITDQVLAAKGDIIFDEGGSVVSGNVNGYGSSIDFTYDQSRNNYGGILVGNTETASVTIKGNMSSRNSIKMMTTGSNLSVRGDLYANSLYVHTVAENIIVDVDHNIYLYSDLFIGGNNATVNIATSNTDATGANGDTRADIDTYIPNEGSLFGLLSVHPVAGDSYTRTGSIIISETVDAPTITLNGLFLNGVIRYDVAEKDAFVASANEEAYKTGESFTTYKNKEYYQTLSTSSIYQSGVISYLQDFIMNTASRSDDPDNLVQLVSFNTALDASLDQTKFRAIHFFTTGFYAFQERKGGAKAPFVNNDIDDVDKSIIRLRNPKLEGNEFYGVNALGLIQFKDDASIDSGKIYHPDRMDLTAMNNNRASVFGAIDLNANILGFADYNNVSLVPSRYHEVDLLKTRVDSFDEDGDGDTSEIINGWLDYSGAHTVENLDKGNIAIFNKDVNKDIYINFDTLFAGSINIRGDIGINNEIFEGSIVSEGNVYINANGGQTMTFRGNIISNKDIILTGSGIKNIEHDEFVIYSIIDRYDDLKTLYDTRNGRRLSDLNTGAMFNNDLFLTLVANPTVIDVNYAESAIIGGTTIVDSKALFIESWLEED